MTLPRSARRGLSAADIAALLLFCAFAAAGWRAVADAPFLQKERVTREEALSDISEFFRRIERTHPAPSVTPAQYAALKVYASSAAEAGLDEFGRLEVRELARILYRSAAGLGDSGTKVLWRPPRKWKDPDPRFPPFSLGYAGGKFLLGNAYPQRLNGGELLAVGGTPLKEFLRPALELVSGETSAHRAYLFCRDQAAWWDISGLFAGNKTVKIKARDKEGKTWSGEVSPVTAGEFRRLTLADARGGTAFYPQKKEAVVRPAAMDHSWRTRKAYRGIFNRLKAEGTRRLVLDLRDCPGGDRRAAEYLLALLEGWAGGGAAPARAALITGPGSGPAAAWLAARFRELKGGELLGEETGGTAEHFGAARTFKLGASGIRFEVSSRYFPAPGGAAGPVAPDLRPAAWPPPRGGDGAGFALERLRRKGG